MKIQLTDNGKLLIFYGVVIIITLCMTNRLMEINNNSVSNFNDKSILAYK